MATILVVDDAAICREPIAAALRQRGYRTLEAGGGDEALSQIRERKPDLMLLDLNMPQPDGLAVLRAVRRNPDLRAMPVIVLTELSDRDHVIQAAERGVQGYILKSRFSLDELCRRVAHCLEGDPAKVVKVSVGASGAGGDTLATTADHDRVGGSARAAAANALDGLNPVITRDDLIRLVNEGLELRPLGSVVGQVAAVAGNPSCSAEDLAKVVMQDQALSIRLLKMANSSAYSRGRSVDSLREAVQRIGTNEVRSLVVTLGVVEQYQGEVARHVDPRLFWEHSIACGLIAASLATTCGAAKSDDYFLWGLLHDVGRIIMLDHVPDAYAAVFEAAQELDLPLEQVEPRLMLLDHCHILERALEFWQFPRAFIAPVANHHQPLSRIKRLGPGHEKATAAIALADRLAHAMLLGSSGNDVVYPINDLVDALGIKGPTLRQIEQTVIREAENLKLVMLVRTAEGPWPDLRQTVRKRLKRPLSSLFISKDPEVDAFRIAFERLATPLHDGEGQAGKFNLGVVHLTHPAEQTALLDRFAKAEKDAGCKDLPLLIITARSGVPEDARPARRCATLPAPVRLDRLVAAINELLEP